MASFRTVDPGSLVARVFISYARKDGRQLADRLAEDLERHHHEPWLDRAEIHGGEQWSREIEDAIDTCDVALAVLTAGSYASPICRGEQARALRKNKRVVPLLAQEDADRPIYLESAHYLDFTNVSLYAQSFTRLLESLADTSAGIGWNDLPRYVRERLDTEGNLRDVATPLRGPTADWSQLCVLAGVQRDRFLEGLASRRAKGNVFEPALYVSRVDQESELERFLASDSYALVLVGDSGVGKTNVLCHWTDLQAKAGHLVLMYQCDKLASSDIEHAVMRDLGVEDSVAVQDFLASLDDLAVNAGRCVVIALDGINDFRGRQGEVPQDLLGAIDTLVSRLPGRSLRVVFSSSTPTWGRLERLGATQLAWSRYHRTQSGDRLLAIGYFNEIEAESAYERYRQYFGSMPPAAELRVEVRLRLRDPLLLRLLAETREIGIEDRAQPSLYRVYQRYYAERVRRPEDRLFIDELVGEMLEEGRAALPFLSLARHARLGPAVASDEVDNSFNRLLDEGVLMQVPGDLFTDDLVKFTYPVTGAFALAGRLLREDQLLVHTIRELAAKSRTLSLAWEAAVAMLAVRGDLETYATLGATTDPELRELATEGLVRLQEVDNERARTLLTDLLGSDSPEQQRTALRAAYLVGPATRDLFVRAAMSGSEGLRQAVRDTLYLIWTGTSGFGYEPTANVSYLIWRHAPDFTYRLMRELAERVSWRRPIESNRILRFVLDLAITIYVNHCDRDEVAQQTADLFYELTVSRLRLDRVNLGKTLERVVFKAVASVFSRRLLDWMLFTELESPETFFELPLQRRTELERLAPLLDPRAELNAAEDLIRDMLRSEIAVFRGAATLVLAIHAHANFPACIAMHRRLFDSLDEQGRLWQLIGFAVLLPDASEAWVRLLEEFTARLLDESPQLVFERSEMLEVFDILFLPLGLAYGKRGKNMPLFDQLLADLIAGYEDERIARVVVGLGPVGFYYPMSVIETLRPHMAYLKQNTACRDSLVNALATIRTLHFDQVDTLLVQTGADEALRREVAATTDVALVYRFMHLLGYYNNAVHYCLHYPRMRRRLGMFALERLARTTSASDFIAEYAAQAIDMARESGFRLLEWTLPDER